jgi:DNA-directed RNA polymerase specialized sigma24 family protein
VFRLLTDTPEETVEENLGALCGLKIQLSPEEKLLLKLCYHDTLSVTRAGAMLGLNRHQAHGRMRRLLARLRADFQSSGLSRDILELLR